MGSAGFCPSAVASDAGLFEGPRVLRKAEIRQGRAWVPLPWLSWGYVESASRLYRGFRGVRVSGL